MKSTSRILGALALLLFSLVQTFGVVDQALQVQGTNLVLSWPSLGYEYYMIQYWPDMQPGTSPVQLTNNYHANSTNRTTFIVPCCALASYGGGSSTMMVSGGGGNSLSSSSMVLSEFTVQSEPSGLWAMPKNGSGGAVPLDIYPPGFNTNTLEIFEAPPQAAPMMRLSGISGGTGPIEADGPDGGNGPLDLTSGGCNCPDMGFFRVFHIPDWAFNATNYVYDGPTFFPVDFKDYMDRVENIEVLLDGQPISDAVFLSLYYNNQTNWGMGIYFDMFSNGTHQIQLRSTVRVTDQVGDTSTFVTLTNFARNITIANEVTFTNWDDLIQSSNFTFKAQTKTNETDWWIDIYDAWGNYVNGGSGHTTNAQISWTWDLTDTSSNFRDNLDSDPFFISYVTIARAGTGTQTTRHTPAAQTAYPDTGYWLISYCDKFYTDAGPRYSNGDQYYTAGIQGMEGWVTYRSIPASDFPIKFGTNSYSQQQRNDSWADLKATLFDPRYRNFYYHGHGGPSMIGGDNHTFDTNGYVTGAISYPNSKAYLTSQSVSNELTFNRHAGSRPYRFAWLDGCSTANGNWPGTFGVPKTTNALSYYTNIVSNPQHRRPSVFVGWDRIVGGNGWGSAQGHWNFNGQVFQEWSYNWQTKVLTQAFSDARHDAVWPPGGDNQLWDALRVYGYTVMRFDEYNHKTDWQWP